MGKFTEILAPKANKGAGDATEKYVGMKLEIDNYKVLAEKLNLDPAVCTGADVFKAMLVVTLKTVAPELLAD